MAKREEAELTYEQKAKKLDEILTRLDDSDTPIDKLAEDVKEGARLIKELERKLKASRPRSRTPSRSWARAGRRGRGRSL